MRATDFVLRFLLPLFLFLSFSSRSSLFLSVSLYLYMRISAEYRQRRRYSGLFIIRLCFVHIRLLLFLYTSTIYLRMCLYVYTRTSVMNKPTHHESLVNGESAWFTDDWTLFRIILGNIKMCHHQLNIVTQTQRVFVDTRLHSRKNASNRTPLWQGKFFFLFTANFRYLLLFMYIARISEALDEKALPVVPFR